MFGYLHHYWNRISDLGVEDDMSFSFKRKIILSNQLGVGLVCSNMLLGLFLSIRYDSLLLFFLFFFVANILWIIPFLNSRGKIYTSRLLICLLLSLTTTFVPIIFRFILPNMVSEIYFFVAPLSMILSLVLAFLLLDFDRKSHFYIGILSALFLMVSIRPLHFLFGLEFSETILVLDSYFIYEIVLFFIGLSIIGVFFLFQRINATYSKNTQIALRQLEEKNDELNETLLLQQTILNAVPDPMFYISKELNIKEIYARRIQDVPKMIKVGSSLKELLNPENYELVKANIKYSLSTGKLAVFEYEIHLNGQLRHHEGRILGLPDDEIFFIVRDITNKDRRRKLIEKQDEKLKKLLADEKILVKKLQRSEERFRTFMNNSPVSSWITDADKNFLYISKSSYDLFRIRPAENQNFYTIFPKHIADFYANSVDEVIKDGKTTQKIQKGIRTDGSKGIFLVYRFLIKEDNRNLVAGVAIDITEQRNAELKHKENEERYRYLFENNPNPIFLIDPKTLKIVDANNIASQKYGYSRAEFLKMSSINLYHKEDIGAYLRQIKEANLETSKTIENWQHQTKSGKIIYVDVRNHTFTINNVDIQLSIINDITHRIETERELIKRGKQLNSLIESQSNYLIRTDLGGNYTFANNAYLKAYSVDYKSLINTNMFNNIHPEDIQRVKLKVMSCLSNPRKNYSIEFRKFDKNNELLWTDWEFIAIQDEKEVITELQFVGQDISERKLSEIALKKSYQDVANFKNALMNSAIVSITDLDGNFLELNDRFLEFSQYTRTELINKPQSILSSKLHTAEFVKNLWATITKGETWQGELRIKAKNGEIAWVETIINPVRNEQGDIYQYLFVGYLITDKKEAELQLKQLNEELIKQNEQLTEFAFITSHNIRRPLANILGLVDLFNYEDSTDEINTTVIENITLSSKEMDKIVHEVNDILNQKGLTKKE